MRSQLEFAKSRLFSDGGLITKNIKFYPGTDKDATPEEISEEINKAISKIEAGDFDSTDNFDE